MLPLSNDERAALLARARQAIVEAVVHQRIADFSPLTGRLTEPGCAFVTIRCGGRLRGCIGRIEKCHPLGEAIAQCAISAALQDPRFSPIDKSEISTLEVEISVLSELYPILPQSIEVGTHGVFVSRGTQRGLLLPQVAAEHNWSGERFLEETCRKAGLDPGAWREPETSLLGFTAEIFSDADFQKA